MQELEKFCIFSLNHVLVFSCCYRISAKFIILTFCKKCYELLQKRFCTFSQTFFRKKIFFCFFIIFYYFLVFIVYLQKWLGSLNTYLQKCYELLTPFGILAIFCKLVFYWNLCSNQDANFRYCEFPHLAKNVTCPLIVFAKLSHLQKVNEPFWIFCNNCESS